MANLKELRGRIQSTQSTKRITSAMKMVAVARLRSAHENAEKSRPYFERMFSMLNNIQKSSPSSLPYLLLSNNQEANKVLMVTITSDRGLCGPLNSNLFRKINEKRLELQKQGKSVSYISVGKKGSDYINRNHRDEIIAVENHLNVPAPSYEGAKKIAKIVLDTLTSENYSRCFLYYNRFVSAIEQKVEEVSLLPIGMVEKEETSPEESIAFIEYEPSAEDVLEELLSQMLETTIFTALLESFASEQGARMTAMDSANRNAEEMIERLTIKYNRDRQANITSELIEVISGAAAV